MTGLGNIDDVYEHYLAVIEENAQLKELLKECKERLIYCTISTHDVQAKIDEVLK